MLWLRGCRFALRARLLFPPSTFNILTDLTF